MKKLTLLLLSSVLTLSGMERPHSAPNLHVYPTLQNHELQLLLAQEKAHVCLNCENKENHIENLERDLESLEKLTKRLERELEFLRALCKELHVKQQSFNKVYIDLLKANTEVRTSRQ